MFSFISPFLAIGLLAGGLPFAPTIPVLPPEPVVSQGVPSTLLGCSDPSRSGGWSSRDFVSTESWSASELPVRSRSARLSEPCFTASGDEGIFRVPVTLTDISVSGDAGGVSTGPDGFFDFVDKDCQGGTSGEVRPVPGSWRVASWQCDPWNPIWGALGAGSAIELSVLSSNSYNSGTLSAVRLDTTPGSPGSVRFYAWCFDGESFAPAAGSPLTLTNAEGNLNAGWTGTAGKLSAGEVHTIPFDCGAGQLGRVSYTNGPGGAVASAGEGWHMDGFPSGPLVIGDVGEFGGTQAAQFSFWAHDDALASRVPKVTCAAEYGGAPVDYFVSDGITYVGTDTNPEPPVVDSNGDATAWSVSVMSAPSFTGQPINQVRVSDCRYLLSVTFTVCQAAGLPSPGDPGGVGSICGGAIWSADSWTNRSGYPVGGPDVGLCTLAPWTPGCFEILNPRPPTAAELAAVCDNPPALEWGDWGWLGAFVGHYAECLFNPVGGWDWDGQISGAWNGSAAGEISSLIGSVGSAVEPVGSCGVIMDATGTVVPAVINTCSWSWAAPFKTFLYWAILGVSGIGLIYFIGNTIIGVLFGKPSEAISQELNRKE